MLYYFIMLYGHVRIKAAFAGRKLGRVKRDFYRMFQVSLLHFLSPAIEENNLITFRIDRFYRFIQVRHGYFGRDVDNFILQFYGKRALDIIRWLDDHILVYYIER